MDIHLEEKQGVRLAIEGCGHGTLHAIYASIDEACKRKNWPGVDLLIVGGDFQSVRNAYDLRCVSMPAKYRSMCDFHEYYSGKRQAPYLTIFVGGNHEASNYLFELYYGGWVAPNIYYMGAANVLRLGPLRIAGMSGIWKGYNYRKPHFERLPYNESDLKSIYHVRELDTRKLLQITTQVDIGISHDWPKGIEWKGNFKQLFRRKAHLEEDARNGQLGSVAAQQVLDWLRPKYWFSAHLHCKYAAIVQHGVQYSVKAMKESGSATSAPKNDNEIDLDNDLDQVPAKKNEDELDLDLDDDMEASVSDRPIAISCAPQVSNSQEIDLDLDEDWNGVASAIPTQDLDGANLLVESNGQQSASSSSLIEARAALPASFTRPPPPPKEELTERPSAISNTATNFLALDKCMPHKDFLQLTDIPIHGDDGSWAERRPFKLEYDREWLAITRAFARCEPLLVGDITAQSYRLKSQKEYLALIKEQETWVIQNLSDADVVVPENFEVTAPVYDGGDWNLPQYSQIEEQPNPQTARFCELLQIPNALSITNEERVARMAAGPRTDPDGERFTANKRGRGGFGQGRGRGDGRGRGRGNGRGRGFR
ncbi:DBR1-domain-containing protein [Acrodontium crateriforme]|uniref:DBR1-domain-containing protein n=1 Tax=Acrodontium crateriforme TaxID=150365 RepID=A0AAQ3MA80_9PEZI|nr:DBR1-domain-containing protein [Acrodontium crateriforme]